MLLNIKKFGSNRRAFFSYFAGGSQVYRTKFRSVHSFVLHLYIIFMDCNSANVDFWKNRGI